MKCFTFKCSFAGVVLANKQFFAIAGDGAVKISNYDEWNFGELLKGSAYAQLSSALILPTLILHDSKCKDYCSATSRLTGIPE